jgi:hypothetical protein
LPARAAGEIIQLFLQIGCIEASQAWVARRGLTAAVGTMTGNARCGALAVALRGDRRRISGMHRASRQHYGDGHAQPGQQPA